MTGKTVFQRSSCELKLFRKTNSPPIISAAAFNISIAAACYYRGISIKSLICIESRLRCFRGNFKFLIMATNDKIVDLGYLKYINKIDLTYRIYTGIRDHNSMQVRLLMEIPR